MFSNRRSSYLLMIGFIFLLTPHFTLAQSKKKTPTVKEATKELDTRAIRTHTNEIFTRMAGNVEELADAIFVSTNDIVIANRALLWKINAIGAAQHAFFDNDPIIALLDAYGFAIQQEEFFTTGNGKEIFGAYQPEVVAFATKLHLELKTNIENLCGEHNYQCDVIVTIDSWAKENPVESMYFNRHSVIEYMADVVGPFKSGIGKSVVEMTESLQDMSSRMNIYSQILPKQMRWEMQLVIAQLEMKQLLDTAMNTMVQINEISSIMPGKMDSLLAISMAEMHLITETAMNSMSGERLAMQDWASVLTDTMTGLMLNESSNWEHIINQQRELAFSGADEMMKASTEPMQEIIDHAFWRGLQLLLIAIILATAAYLLIRKIK